ncbi:hypothetical protein I4U23_030183 [Adineta vaga]|nr:hypothetical protein I4U23_030183 [Adineta vaga]
MLKRTLNRTLSNTDESVENIPWIKYSRNIADNSKSTFENLCPDILLEIFQYIRPTDLLHSFFNVTSLLDNLLEPYMHTLDIRLINKSYFNYLIESILPSLSKKLRVLRLSNTYTFSQISDLFCKFDWIHINQLESLSFDSIKSDELSKYFLTIHPKLEQLWRLSLTFDEQDDYCEKLILNRILFSQSSLLKNCFINGITFDLSKSILPQSNKNLRELTITLTSIKDLLILFQMIPHLEILTCTISADTSVDNIDQIASLNSLTSLTLIINERIEFKTLQNILIPHTKLRHLSLTVILIDKNSNKEINGFEFEKLFRRFSQLIELHFYFRHVPTDSHPTIDYKSDSVYLSSFTTHFWLDRSIEVCTHFIPSCNQRYVYTIPFAFDKFDVKDDIAEFFLNHHLPPFSNVKHLVLSANSHIYEFIYSNIICKLFPKLHKITFSSKDTLSTLKKHRWIEQKGKLHISYVFLSNNSKSRCRFYQKLDILSEDQRIFANNSKHIRELTIYEMTKDQLVYVNYFFSQIHVLTLYVDTCKWFSLSIDWLHHLLTNMVSLFSLTIYYPKDTPVGNLQSLLVSELLAVKKYFFVKCTDGILNIWF